MTEDQAYAAFCRMRWAPTGGLPICARCGSTRYYELGRRHRFACRSCRAQYSATSGTVFHARKLSFIEIMEGINLANGYRLTSTLGLSKELEVQWKTAAILSDKAQRLGAAAWGTKGPTWRSRSRLGARSRRARMPHYPYLALGHKESGVDLLLTVAKMVPRNIRDFLRADICQDLIVSLLSGEITTSALTQGQIRKIMRRTFRMYDLSYQTISLDAPLTPASEATFREFLTYEAMDRWDTPSVEHDPNFTLTALPQTPSATIGASEPSASD